MNERPTILVVEDDAAMRELLEDELREAEFKVLAAADGVEALERLARYRVDAVVTDLQMPQMKGRELLDEVRAREPEVPVIIITAFGTIDSAVDAMKAGAYHFVPKPFSMEQLLETVRAALRDRRLREDLALRRSEVTTRAGGLVAESHGMQKAVDLVLRAAPADSPVLLLGESGTGKELLARVLHERNPGRRGKFVAVNCSAIPETLLESQLFGHRRGAFTDAREDRMGLFQEAEGGTVFLDEIGDMPLALQAKLLRVLQEKEVHPLGAADPVRIDVRVVAATNRNLAAVVEEGRFRQDLYYRLNVIVIRIPPLRERPEDLLPLIAHFLEKHGARTGRRGRTLSGEALTLMQRHVWPGNVRELENCIERALVLGTEEVIGIEDLPEALRARAGAGPAGGAGAAEAPLPEMRPVAEVEREHILRTLRAVGGNKAAAARLLGLDRKTLYRKLSQYRIEP